MFVLSCSSLWSEDYQSSDEVTRIISVRNTHSECIEDMRLDWVNGNNDNIELVQVGDDVNQFSYYDDDGNIYDNFCYQITEV